MSVQAWRMGAERCAPSFEKDSALGQGSPLARKKSEGKSMTKLVKYFREYSSPLFLSLSILPVREGGNSCILKVFLICWTKRHNALVLSKESSRRKNSRRKSPTRRFAPDSATGGR